MTDIANELNCSGVARVGGEAEVLRRAALILDIILHIREAKNYRLSENQRTQTIGGCKESPTNSSCATI